MIKFNQRELIVPYIILFIVMFVSVYPLLYMISVSFMTAGEASNQYLIPKELRFENEPVRHKALDIIGDLALLGMPLQGHVIASKSGHAANVELVKKIKKVYQKKILQQQYQQSDKGGFISAHWDGTKEVEAQIKQETKATVRCIPLEKNPEAGKCMVTGSPSGQRALFAIAY